MEVLITQYPKLTIGDQELWSVRLRALSDKILAQLLRGRELKSELVSQVTGGCVTGTALALKPPLSPKGGVVLLWVHQT